MNKRSLKRLHYKKILILVGEATDEKKRLGELIGGFVDSGIEVKLDTFSNLTFELEDGKVFVRVSGRDIRDFNLVYIRSIDSSLSFTVGTLAFCLDYFKIKYFNTRFRNVRAVNDKLTSLITLTLNGFPTMPTFFCGREGVESNIDYLVKKYNYPIVVKEVTTHHSKGLFVMRKREDFQKLINRENKKRVEQFLFQKFVPIEKEYRLLVLGNSVRSAQKMYRDLGGFQSYIDYDKKEEFVGLNEISSEAKEIAVRSANILNMQIAGVDVLITKFDSKIMLIEVNSSPGFTYDTSLSPEIPQLAKFLEEEVKKE